MRQHQTQFLTVVLVTLTFTAFSIPLLPSTQAQIPLFTLYVGAVQGNPGRVAYAGVITDSFRRIGIDARLILADWTIWFDRVLFPNVSILGATYEEGGWDTFFLGWTWGSSWIDPTYLFDNDSIPLFNFCLINDSQVEELLDNIRSELDPATRIQYQKDLQALTHDLSALQVLFYPNTTWAYDPNLVGFENQTYIFPQYGDPMFRNSVEAEIRVGQNGDPRDFNPILSASSYDEVVNVVYDSLFYYTDNEAMFNFDLSPSLAAGPWIVENNGLNWTLQLREDIYWPDGFQFNASDVIMSFKAIITPKSGASLYDKFVASGLTNESFHILNPHTIRVTFNDTMGPFAWTPQMLGTIPIMSFAQIGHLAWDDWQTHGTNTGAKWTGIDINGDPFDVYGPYGLGAYVCRLSSSGWNAGSRIFIADQRSGSNDPGLANGTVIPYHEGNNGRFNIQLNYRWIGKIITGASAAIDALEAGEIDIINEHFQIQHLQDLIDPAWGSIIAESELALQSLGMNMLHPIVGTGIDTPNGQSDPVNASRYAKYVRQALNHLIPREAIINMIFDGLGVPGNEYMPPNLPAFNTDIAPYHYDVEQAKELLQMAGYQFPTEPIVIPPDVLLFIFGVGIIVVQIFLLTYLLVRQKRKDITKNHK
jgi:ABC-type transport system substrate-binding protein